MSVRSFNTSEAYLVGGYFPHVRNMPTAVLQPRMFVNGPLVRFRITFLLFETSLMMTIQRRREHTIEPNGLRGGRLRMRTSPPGND